MWLLAASLTGGANLGDFIKNYMHCKHCGNKMNEGARFCTSCGKESAATTQGENTVAAASSSEAEAIIKCGNCGFIGPGEHARNLFFTILAWLCVVFAPLITIIYFVATSKYRCPKCKSTFLGVKNKDGVFVGRNGGSRIAVIVIAIILGIAILGILSSVVLASLNSARMKGRDARRIADVKQLQLGLELYYDDKDAYPKTLTALAPEYIDEIPTDPTGGHLYAYSYCSTDSYHLGASLEQQSHSALASDADNVSICRDDRVNGDDSEKCLASDSGSYCFDVTPWAGDTTSFDSESEDVVQVQDIVVGTGTEAVPGTEVSVLYEGMLEDGTVFDSSEAYGNETLTFTLGDPGLISGFQIGVNGMRVGGERLISIPPSLGYGDEDITDEDGNVVVPSNSTLIFNVRLQEVRRI